MAKVLFLIFHGFAPSNGISKKIFYQIAALNRCGNEAELCYLEIDENGHQKRMTGTNLLRDYGNSFMAKVRKRTDYSAVQTYIREHGIELLYIRNDHNANPFLNRFLRQVKQTGVHIAMEIPTYPYDQEYLDLNAKDKFLHLFDKIFRQKMAGYVDRIVTFSEHKEILGVPTINISNGIDFGRIQLRQGNTSHDGELHLIGVADIRFWHGFDRILTGMANYYRTEQDLKVIFHIVGGGLPEEIEKLRHLVAHNNLEPYVIFHGPQAGEQLDALFEQADMGVASLGRHRSGITNIKTLKTREYAARGIPFIYSENDDDFENMPYILKAPADESPINITELTEFFFRRRFTPEEIRGSILATLSWDIQMKKVTDAMAMLPHTKKARI